MDPIPYLAMGIVLLVMSIRQLFRGLIAHYLPPEHDEEQPE